MLTDQDRDNLQNRFTYHAPKGDQAERYQVLRGNALNLALLIKTLVPDSAEQTLALRKLEESIFWANAGIARNE